MEFNVDLQALQKATKLLGAVASQNDDSSDGHVLLDIRDNGDLVLLVSTGILSITHVIHNCEVKSTGNSAVSFGKLSSFLAAIAYINEGVGAKIVNIKGLKNDVSLVIKSTSSSKKLVKHALKLQLQQTQRIAVPTPFTNTTFEINSATLRLAIPKVLYAVDRNSIRTFLQGINISFDKDCIYFAGTDAQKLSEYTTPNTSKLHSGNYILPYMFISSLRRIVDTDSPVLFCIDSGRIKVMVNNTVLHGSLLIGEEYPNYKEVFKSFTHTITIDKNEFLSSLAPILPSLNKEDLNRLSLVFDNKKLIIKNEYAEAEYVEDIDFDGSLTIDLNGSYLVSTLMAIMDDIITMQFSDNEHVVIFDSAQFNNQKALITPIRRR
jgi:DNA polymerase III sliding clamp (beta) subunit (PCNA family)